MIRQGGWYWFLSGEGAKLERHKCGKWMYFLKISPLHSRYARRPLRSKYAMSASVPTWKCSLLRRE